MSLQANFFRRSFARPTNRQRIELQKKRPILIAEAEDIPRQHLVREALLHRGFTVVESLKQGGISRHFLDSAIQLAIVGGSWKGLEAARQIRKLDAKLPVILIAAESSESLAIAALKVGVNDYFGQTYSIEDLISSIYRYAHQSFSGRSQKDATRPARGIIDGDRIIGDSLAMREIRAAIGRIASTDSNVLITGETGTGKELVAELIHKNSPRSRQPFVCINCAAIPDTLLESELFGYERGSFTGAYSSNKGKLMLGQGGTIFLDEIGDMSPYAQAKILRVIESREVQRLGGRENLSLDVRFIAATNKDLGQSVAEKTFRRDLYYRLNVAGIHLPFLKDRKEDVPALSEHFISALNRRFGRQIDGFTEETAEILLRYDWPGNVRELKNFVEATIGNFRCRQDRDVKESCAQCPEFNPLCRQISFMDIPEQYRARFLNAKALPEDERDPLLSVLISTNWNVSKAAQKLHWSRMTVYRKMAKYHIHPKEKK